MDGEGGAYIPLIGIVEDKGQQEVEIEWAEASQNQAVGELVIYTKIKLANVKCIARSASSSTDSKCGRLPSEPWTND